MSELLVATRGNCRKAGRRLLEARKSCHLIPGHRTDGCGYFQDKYAYLSVDCRMVKGMPLCWISIIDHYSGEVLYSAPCENTPEAAAYGRAYFMPRKPRR
jgi:hypothetical protein